MPAYILCMLTEKWTQANLFQTLLKVLSLLFCLYKMYEEQILKIIEKLPAMFSKTGWLFISEQYIQGLVVLFFISTLGFWDLQRFLYPEIVFLKQISYSVSWSLNVIDRKYDIWETPVNWN